MGSIIGAVLPSVIGLGASLIGGSKQKKASRSAERARVAAAQEARQHAREAGSQIQANLEPYNQVGMMGIAGLADRFHDDDLLSTFDRTDLHEDPGYQFRLQEGQRALDRTANARQGIFSGRQLRRTSRYGQLFAMDEFDRARQRHNEDRDARWDKIMGITDLGATATNWANAAIGGTADRLIDAAGFEGSSRAHGATERGAIGANTWDNIGKTVGGLASMIKW